MYEYVLLYDCYYAFYSMFMYTQHCLIQPYGCKIQVNDYYFY